MMIPKDQTDLEKAVKQVRRQLNLHAAGDDVKGVSSRLALAVVPPFMTAVSAEIRGDTMPDLVFQAVADSAANMIASAAESVTFDPEQRAKLSGDMLTVVSLMLADRFLPKQSVN